MAKIIGVLIFVGSLAIMANAIHEQSGTKVLPGQNANIGEMPFMAEIWQFPSGDFLCGGAIIDDFWILTSAECIYNYTTGSASAVRVTVGGVQLVVNEVGEVQIPAASLWIHPNFRPPRAREGGRLDEYYYNNIGLIYLALRIPMPSTQIATAALGDATESMVPGDTVVIAGWGGVTETSPVNQLQYSTNLHLMTSTDCARAVPGTEFDEYHICTASYPDATACKYDHGGPLFKFDPVRGVVILGVINYAPCWDSNHPTVYASVPAYRNWIYTVSGI